MDTGPGPFCLLLTGLLLAASASPTRAQTDVTASDSVSLRVAFYRIDLGGRGPGYALRDILARAPVPDATARIIAHKSPDILGLSGLDYDHGGVALSAFADLIAEHGHRMEHSFTLRPNSGWQTGLDLDGNGRVNTPDDAHGYGSFAGEKGLAILSRYPIDSDSVRDFSQFLWRDLPEPLLPEHEGRVFPNAEIYSIQRLSSTGHWDVPIQISQQHVLNILLFQAGPPVFGGRHERNRNRNHDEVAFWTYLLDAELPYAPPRTPFVLMGGTNLDPHDGDGIHASIRVLLAHPALQDPAPQSDGARIAAQAPNSAAHTGPHALDTVHWPQTPGPGNLRVSYVLPSAGIKVAASGVFWPASSTPEAVLLGTDDDPPTRHRLVWADITIPPRPSETAN